MGITGGRSEHLSLALGRWRGGGGFKVLLSGPNRGHEQEGPTKGREQEGQDKKAWARQHRPELA